MPATTRIPLSITEATDEDWDRIHASSPDGTYYQCRNWFNLLCRHRSPRHEDTPLRAGAWHFRFGDGLEGIIPFLCFRATRGLDRKYASGGDLLYGGWVGVSYPETHHAEALGRFLSSKNVTVRISPFARGEMFLEGFARTDEFSAVLDLSPGIESIEGRWRVTHPKLLQYSRKAARAGVEVRRAREPREWDEFAEVHAQLLQRRSDATIYSREFFRSLHATRDECVHLWVARHNDRVIGGQLALVHKSHVGLFVKGATAEGLSLKAPILIDRTMITHYAREGHRWYDHDGCGSPDASIAEYKRRLGCIFMSSPILTRERGLLALASYLKRSYTRIFTRGAGASLDLTAPPPQ